MILSIPIKFIWLIVFLFYVNICCLLHHSNFEEIIEIYLSNFVNCFAFPRFSFMYLAAVCSIRIFNSYLLCVFKSTKNSVLINALGSLNLSKYISSSLLCVFNPYFLVHFISFQYPFISFILFLFCFSLWCLRAYNPAVFFDLSSFLSNERNQCIHIQWWCLDNCASYISHNIFFFTSLVAHFDFPYFCWLDNTFFPQGKTSVFQSTIFWEDAGSNKRPNIPWFSSNNQKITIVYNLIRHVLNIYSVNRFFRRETLMKAVLIHLEGLPEDL